jgi:hypothetical protein
MDWVTVADVSNAAAAPYLQSTELGSLIILATGPLFIILGLTIVSSLLFGGNFLELLSFSCEATASFFLVSEDVTN